MVGDWKNAGGRFSRWSFSLCWVDCRGRTILEIKRRGEEGKRKGLRGPGAFGTCVGHFSGIMRGDERGREMIKGVPSPCAVETIRVILGLFAVPPSILKGEERKKKKKKRSCLNSSLSH
jgi:hypothetical protein